MLHEETHITPFVGNDEDLDIILLFTDNNSEPKRLNVRRAIEGDDNFTGNALNYEGDDLKDFISSCSKTVLNPVTFEFTTENTTLGATIESSFGESDGFIFSYQNIYEDGFRSPMALLSKVAYPPSLANLGKRSISDIILENTCILSIPKQSQEIARIRILFKKGDNGTWKIMDEVSTSVEQGNENFDFMSDSEDLVGKYTFRNDRVYAILAADEAKKNFDSVPQIAGAQSVTGNRLMYGDFIEGFDRVQAKAVGTVEFKDRPKDLVSFTLEANPLFVDNNVASAIQSSELGASTGFEIDGSGIPEILEEGIYEVKINIRPQRNIHVYDTKAHGYRGSKNISTEDGLDFSATPSIPSDSDYAPPNISNPDGSSGPASTPMFSQDSAAATLYWNNDLGASFEAKLGTTASAPLILDINNIEVSMVLEITSGTTVSNLQFISAVSAVLTASSGDPNLTLDAVGINLVSVQGNLNPDVFFGTFANVNIDVGLNSGAIFSQTSSRAELICSIGRPSDNRPAAFIIINKAIAKIGFEEATSFDNTEGTKKGIRLKVVNVVPEDILVCLPKPAIGGGSIPHYINEAFGEVDTFYPGSEQPWICKHAIPNETAAGSGSDVIWWPQIEAPIKDGFIPSEVDAGFAFNRIPYRIGEWLVLDSVGIDNEDWQDFYSVTLEGIQGTNYAGSSDINTESRTFSASHPSTIFPSFAPLSALFGNSASSSGIGILNLQVEQTLFTYGSTVTNSAGFYLTGKPTDFQFAVAPELDPELENFVVPPFTSRLSIVDGDAGPGGRMNIERPFSDTSIGEDGTEEAITHLTDSPGQSITGDATLTNPVHNRWGSVWGPTLIGYVDNMPFLNPAKVYSSISSAENTSSLDPIKKGAFEASPAQHTKIISSISGLGGVSQSFKTRATHDFGIVYYDQRGRMSAVNQLSSVYVPGYSDTERPSGTPRGAVSINLELKHFAPEWATDYRIFYSNRNNAKRFIQYTAADAYTKKGTNPLKNKIYVSLAHLQSHDISYAQSYGARTHDTDEATLYRYSPGDKLRIISYYTTDDDRVWVDDDAVFDVLGTETLAQNQNHPLVADSEGDFDLLLQTKGEFVVIKNNDLATGFTTTDIDGGTSKWNDRVVFEIVSPESETVEAAQPYFETKHGGKINKVTDNDGNDTYVHEFNEHLIEEGDVFFRGVPLNVQDFDTATSTFTNRIDADVEGNDISQPRFERYHLETEAVSDLYSTAAKGYGKPNFVRPLERRQRQNSSIIFSQKTDPSTFNLKYNSFHPLEENSFQLPEKYGRVDYMVGKDEYVTTLQENKAAIVPLDRVITQTATGQQTLNLSEAVLNAGTFYPQDFGPSGNPESVVVVDGKVYFVDKGNQAVISIKPRGEMEIISNYGMEEYFKRQIKTLLDNSETLDKKDIRIVGGFDPNENEVIFSFSRPSDINSNSINGISFGSNVLNNLGPTLEFNSEDEPLVNTIAFDHSGGKAWKTRYSFNSSNYARVNNKFISFKNVGSNLVWSHGTSTLRNNFHGAPYYSMIKSVSNSSQADGPSATKEYRALSFEGNSQWPSIVRTEGEKAKVPSFNRYEGSEHSSIGGSEGSMSSTNIKAVGVVESFEGVEGAESPSVDVRFTTPVNRYPLNIGNSVEVYFVPEGFTQSSIVDIIPTQIVDTYTVRYVLGEQTLGDAFVGSTILHRANAAIYGDTPRGKFMTITSYNNSSEPVELYAINVETKLSRLNTSS